MVRVFYAFVIICSLVLKAQDAGEVDSLKVLLQGPLSYKERVKVLNQLAYKYSSSDSSKTYFYALESIRIADSIHFQEGVMDAKYQLGWINLVMGNYDVSASYFEEMLSNLSTEMDIPYTRGKAKALNGLGIIANLKGDYVSCIENWYHSMELIEQMKDTAWLSSTYNNLGIVYQDQGDLESALSYYIKSLTIKDKLGDQQGISITKHNIALVYQELGKFEEALAYLRDNLRSSRQLSDHQGEVYALNELGHLFLERGELREAKDYLLEALKIGRSIGDRASIAYSLRELGAVSTKQGAFEDGIAYCNQSLELNRKIDNKAEILKSIHQLGRVYHEAGQQKKALEYYEECLLIAEELGQPRLTIDCLEDTYRAQKEVGDHLNALINLEHLSMLRDSLGSVQLSTRLSLMDNNYHFQKEKDSIHFANTQQRQLLEADIAKSNTKQLITFILLIVATVVIGLSVFFNRKLKALNRVVRKRNREIIKQRDHLEKLNKAKTRFFSIISHDLRSPMSVLINFNRMIKKHLEQEYDLDEDKKLNEYSGFIVEASDNIQALLDGLIKWAIKEEGVMPYHPELVNLRSMIEENIQELRPQAASKSIDLSYKIEEPINAWIDKNSMMTILRNLTSNAMKFTPANGRVVIEAHSENGHVKLVVEDTGVGIPKDKMKSLFDINESKVSWGTGGEKGFGLGLNLVHDFVKMNKGDISVESELNKGSRFILTFPAQKQTA